MNGAHERRRERATPAYDRHALAAVLVTGWLTVAVLALYAGLLVIRRARRPVR